MSAYVVSKTHVDILVKAGLMVRGNSSVSWFGVDPGELKSWEELRLAHRELRLEIANEVGQLLATENVRSVRACYGDADPAGMIPDWTAIPYV
jgi:hypothetical protein